MAVKTNITINIVEPGSDVPVPDTGLFTHGVGGTETTIIVSAALVTILVILSIVLTTYMYRKHKKQGRTTKLVHIIDQTKAVVKSKKRVTIGLSIIALLVSACTFTAFMLNTNNSNTSAIEGNDTEQQTGNTEQSENTNNLTINAESKELTIEVKDQPVFAVLPVQVTVEEATTAGYTLTAYTDSTDLVSTTNPNNKIPMITIEGDELTSLQDNTWGLALDNEPTAKDNKVYTALSTDQDNPTIIKTIGDYSETPVNDTTTIYYGFYITPDIPVGTYEGGEIEYAAEVNHITTLSFNGNGNDGGEDMESIIIPAGDTITLPENTYTKDGYTFIGWNTVATPTEQEPGKPYADKAAYQAGAESANVTLYAQWKKNILYMQNVSEWGNTLKIGDEVIAVDNRDEKQYYVARLADGNIWMTQNLDHDIVAGKTYTSANTDLQYSAIDTSWTPASSTVTSGWNFSFIHPSSCDPGDRYWNGAMIPDYQSLQAIHSGITINDYTSNNGDAHYHIGNYYSWPAAVAINDTSSSYTSGLDVNQSICPAGWRLPTYSGNKSYQNLISAQGDLISGVNGNVQNSPTYFVYGGSWGSSDGNGYGVGYQGLYWAGVKAGGNGSYIFHFGSNGYLNPQNSINSGVGFSVRCVAR